MVPTDPIRSPRKELLRVSQWGMVVLIRAVSAYCALLAFLAYLIINNLRVFNNL
jgi:hypothetical protein